MNPKTFTPNAPGKLIHTPGGYYAFIPNPLPPRIDWHTGLISILGEADRALARLAEAGRQFPAPYAMSMPFIHQEAVLSSRIEGTRTTLEQLYTYEAVQQSFFGDTREVQNYVNALDYGLKRLGSLPVSMRLVRELHSRLMQGVRGEKYTPGEFRKSQNWIGSAGCKLEDAAYVPPPPDEMQTALADWESFIHHESALPPLVRLAIIHYQFEAIHPFLDGNGRIGRLLIALLMCEWDLLPLPILYLSAYFEANRSEYYVRLLAVSQKGEWLEWIIFFLEGVRAQSIFSAMQIEQLRGILFNYERLLENERASARLTLVLQHIIQNPITTIRKIQQSLELKDYKTAARLVDRLIELNVLHEITGKQRGRIFRADAIWQALNSTY